MNSCRASILPWAMIALLTALGAAQGRIWVVDSTNGPGTDFTTLAPAIAAVGDGETIIVRSGTYAGVRRFATSRSFSLIGTGSPLILGVGTSPQDSALGIDLNGGPQQRISISGLMFAAYGTPVVFANLNSPRSVIHAEDLAIAFMPSPNSVSQGAGMSVSGGLATLRAINSNAPVYLMSCTAYAQNVTVQALNLASVGNTVRPAFAALVCQSASAQFYACRFQAGSSLGSTNPFAADPAPGAVVAAAQLHFGASCYVSADPAPPNQLPGRPVFHGILQPFTTVTHDATATFVPSPQGIVFGSYVSSGVDYRTHLTHGPGTLGGTLVSVIQGMPGHPVALYCNVSINPLSLWGNMVLLDLASAVPLGVGTFDASGRASYTLPLPNDPRYRGTVLELQGFTLHLQAGLVGTTNAAATALR